MWNHATPVPPNGKRYRMARVPEELAVVRRIVTLWRRGGSCLAIAGQLNAEGR